MPSIKITPEKRLRPPPKSRASASPIKRADRRVPLASAAISTRQDGNDIDRFCDQGAWECDDSFLNELLESPQGTERGAGMDGADTAGMACAQALSRSSASAPRTSPIGMRSGRRRREDRTRSDSEITPSLVRSATRFGALH